MAVRQVPLHKSKAESAAGTFTSEIIEVPNSQNAQMVKLDRVLIQVEDPENVAATLTEFGVAVGVGDIKAALDSNATIDASVAGVAAVAFRQRYTTTLYGSKNQEFFPNRVITKSADGKYYISIAVLGANNVAVKTAKISAEFTVM